MRDEIYVYVCMDMSEFSFGESLVVVRPIVTAVAMVGVLASAVWDIMSVVIAITLFDVAATLMTQVPSTGYTPEVLDTAAPEALQPQLYPVTTPRQQLHTSTTEPNTSENKETAGRLHPAAKYKGGETNVYKATATSGQHPTTPTS
ncbi:hypothetical protein Nepgr_003901 [Nepenthes gracilis]|uniref:Uncharacterized protein n=1 Tax=Nepenthes gracilis TaxID=150966 RepID=A0AAD3S0K7_NEPGR|nr:hypothetical protein Nepgr_003901 [Nepenthes gracilis]